MPRRTRMDDIRELAWAAVFVAGAGVFAWGAYKSAPGEYSKLEHVLVVMMCFWAVVWFVRCSLALVNPVVHVRLSSDEVAPGEQLVVRWTFRGGRRPVRLLSISLEGYERVIWKDQKDQTMHEEIVFARVGIADVANPKPHGQASIAVDPSWMHSFRSVGNEIGWRVCVRAQIDRGPDIATVLPVTVLAEREREERGPYRGAEA